MSEQAAKEKQVPILHFRVRGQRPDSSEAAELCSLPFPRTFPSGREVGKGLKELLMCVGTGAFLWFAGRWVIHYFETNPFSGRRFMVLLRSALGLLSIVGAYVIAPLLLIAGIILFCKIFRSVRKKKVEDAMQRLWVTALMGDDAVSERFGKIEYALGVLRRMVPPGRPFDKSEITAYIHSLHKTLGEAADAHTLPAMQSASEKWLHTLPKFTMHMEEVETLFPGVKELHGQLTVEDRLRTAVNNRQYVMITARLKLDITQTFICAGGYWYPYEVTSPIQRIEDSDLN